MKKNICIFGDSIVWGAFDTEKGGWVNRLKIFFETEFKNVSVYNLSVFGDITNDVLDHFQKESQAREANVLVFAIGINDSRYIKLKNNPRTSLGKFKSNLKNLIARSRAFTNKIVFIGLTDIDEAKTMPIPWKFDTYYDKENVFLYNQALKLVCEEEKVFYLDMHGVVDKVDMPDGLHPDSKGHEKCFCALRIF